jgi:hypothetical protein
MHTLTATQRASEPNLGWKTRTEVALRDDRLLALCVRHGDLLRSDAGTVWATIDGDRQDIVLAADDVHVVRADTLMRVSGFGDSRLTIVSGQAACPYPRTRATLGALLKATWAELARRTSRVIGPVPV